VGGGEKRKRGGVEWVSPTERVCRHRKCSPWGASGRRGKSECNNKGGKSKSPEEDRILNTIPTPEGSHATVGKAGNRKRMKIKEGLLLPCS